MIEAAVNIVAKRIRWTDGVGHVDDHVMITLVPLGLATTAMKVPSSVKRPQKKGSARASASANRKWHGTIT